MSDYIITPMPLMTDVYSARGCPRCRVAPYTDCTVGRRTHAGQRHHAERTRNAKNLLWPEGFLRPAERESGFRYALTDPYELDGMFLEAYDPDHPNSRLHNVWFPMEGLVWTDHRMIQLSSEFMSQIQWDHLSNEGA